jgi:transcription elongation factor Elf1
MIGSSDFRRDRQFNEYLSDGITAVKSGNYNLAQSLLNRAVMVNAMDARPYIWLSATTKDVQEQREYLEKAVAIDPMNAAARRGLAMLTGQIDESRLMPEGGALGTSQEGVETEAQGQAFQCPRCGGRMTFSVSKGLMVCEYCGYVHERAPAKTAGPVADVNEKVLDFFMPTTRGHRWAEAQHRLCCERCGALSILPAGQKTLQCAYCGSNQVVESSEDSELLDPQVIGLVKIDAKEAVKRVRQWLGKGLFTPDTLIMAWQRMRLHPAYYSFWTFDGTVELNWSCEVAEGSGNSKRWTPRSGVEMRFFNDVLVSGVKAMTEREQASIEPFNLVDVEEFQPEYLAGWPAILYDRPLSEAAR